MLVLITGGAGRIGASVAQLSLELGATVFLVDLAADKLSALKASLQLQYSERCTPIVVTLHHHRIFRICSLMFIIILGA